MNMKTYKVALTRTYFVTIKAQSDERAKVLSEFYLGDCQDLSTLKERKSRKFKIKNIEIVYNNADEVFIENY